MPSPNYCHFSASLSRVCTTTGQGGGICTASLPSSRLLAPPGEGGEEKDFEGCTRKKEEEQNFFHASTFLRLAKSRQRQQQHPPFPPSLPPLSHESPFFHCLFKFLCAQEFSELWEEEESVHCVCRKVAARCISSLFDTQLLSSLLPSFFTVIPSFRHFSFSYQLAIHA